MDSKTSTQPRIIIIGAGFAGLTAAHELKKNKNIEITLIDKNNYHTFQPFLYQVASADLAPSDIAIPIRSEFKGYENVHVIMGEVTRVDKENREICLKDGKIINYDYLIIATGSEVNYFNHPEWSKYVVSLKTINDALLIRTKVLEAFEKAEIDKKNFVTFTIIGGGPTGVELAGSLYELIKQTLKDEFNYVNPNDSKIILIEASEKLLSSFNKKLSDFTVDSLERKGITLKLGIRVKDLTKNLVILENGEIIDTQLIIWAAGVKASLSKDILGNDVEFSHGNKIKVEPNFSLENYPNIFVIGDSAEYLDKKGESLPGLAAVASQEGKFISKVIFAKINNKDAPKKFIYNNRGNLAIIGRYSAIYEFGKIKLKGWLAWLIWDVVHIYFLIGFRNRIIVFIKWIWNYITHRRSERLIIK
ncbi:MAG: NAD(P)/FAD-dependent oxidoreductase [Sphingobacteriia bacterium]|nr:NAD(P)/FAD-dependent oxidoreductase [Sphingobacteriia bacterium]